MLDVAIVVSVVGLGVAALLFLFKRAGQQDARDEQLREDEHRPASQGTVAAAPGMALDDLRLSNIARDVRRQFDELRSKLR